MNISGPPPPSLVPPQDDQLAALRLNQRFAAEVLQVTGDRVVLSVEGVRIIARLTHSGQAAALTERKLAQFVVREFNGSTVVVGLLTPESSSPPSPGSVTQNLLPGLLRQAGVEVNAQTLAAARALLNHGLQVTPANIAELLDLLAAIPGWGEKQADLAAALKALGLPLSAGALALVQVQENLPALAALIAELQAGLRLYLRGRPAGLSVSLARQALARLAALIVAWDEGDAQALADALRRAVGSLGRPVESDLARWLQGEPVKNLASGWLGLYQLRQQAAAEGDSALVEKLDRFFEGLRLLQYLNARPLDEPSRGRWLRLDLPLGFPRAEEGKPDFDRPLCTAHLRVAYREGSEEQAIDPANTRLVIRVDLGAGHDPGHGPGHGPGHNAGHGGGEVLQVDLSVAGRRLGAAVTASAAGLVESARQELESLQAGLDGLGYALVSSSCEKGEFEPPADQGQLSTVGDQQPAFGHLWDTFRGQREV